MGQGEIFQFLKENEGQIFTSKDISMALDITSPSSALSRLRKYPPEGFNSSKDIAYKSTTYIYWYKNNSGKINKAGRLELVESD